MAVHWEVEVDREKWADSGFVLNTCQDLLSPWVQGVRERDENDFRVFVLTTQRWRAIFNWAVMVNFVCQLDWVEGTQTARKLLFLGVSVRCFQKRSAFESGGWVKQITLTSLGRRLHLYRAWKEQKGSGRVNPSLLDLGQPSSPDFGQEILGPLDLGTYTIRQPCILRLWLQTGDYTVGSSTVGFELGLNFISSFPGCPGCGWQIVAYPSLHNHVSQFPW